jgi:cytochrome b pre-mRNA-processing protein 3
MLDSFRTRAETRRKASEIYGAVVTQARAPQFYADLGVPDTPSGRYEMVALHVFLVLERLRPVEDRASALPRMLVEAFVADMDDSLRELGTGDLAVPKKVRRAAAGLYERSQSYRTALAAPDDTALRALLIEHAYAGTVHPGADALARYVRNAIGLLAEGDAVEALLARRAFPSPGRTAGEAA